MTKKIILNILKVLIVFIILQIIVSNNTYVHASMWGEIFGSADKFIEKGEQGVAGTVDSSKVKDVSNGIYNTLFGIAVALSVVVGGVLGIKFMTSSVEEKAQVKEALIPYVAGCVVAFGSFGIWRLVMVIGSNL